MHTVTNEKITARILIIVAIGVLVCYGISCVGLFYGEWIYHENTFDKWLNENDYRVDFNVYASFEEIRQDLLRKLPPGSSEEEIKSFYLANRDQGPWDQVKWNPHQISGDYGAILRIWSINRGSLIKRLLSGRLIIFLHLDPTDNSLIDITVDGVGFEL